MELAKTCRTHNNKSGSIGIGLDGTNKGDIMRGGGFGLLLLLLAALIAAILFMTNMSSLGVGKSPAAPEQDATVQHTQETVNQLNGMLEERYQQMENL